MLTLAALVALQDAWWDPAWTHRRAVSLRNASDRELPAGSPLEIAVDPEFLALAGKARPGLADLALVRGGARLPHLLRPAPEGGRATLLFALAAPIPPGRADAYALYYGNPAGTPPPEPAFPLVQTFSRPLALPAGGPAVAVAGGALELRDVPPGRSALDPERIDLASGALPAAFTLTFDVDATSPGAAALAVGVDVAVDEAAAPGDRARAEALVRDLGADAFETRESATAALVALGAAARPALQEAARAEDPEIRTRAERALAAIRKASPPPLARAALVGGEVLWKTGAVAGAQSNQNAGRPEDGARRRYRFEIARDPEGAVTVACDGVPLRRGRLPGNPSRVSVVAWRVRPGDAAPLRVDDVVLRPWTDPEERPTVAIELEERRP